MTNSCDAPLPHPTLPTFTHGLIKIGCGAGETTRFKVHNSFMRRNAVLFLTAFWNGAWRNICVIFSIALFTVLSELENKNRVCFISQEIEKNTSRMYHLSKSNAAPIRLVFARSFFLVALEGLRFVGTLKIVIAVTK